jgi:hypothetical protein
LLLIQFAKREREREGGGREKKKEKKKEHIIATESRAVFNFQN